MKLKEELRLVLPSRDNHQDWNLFSFSIPVRHIQIPTVNQFHLEIIIYYIQNRLAGRSQVVVSYHFPTKMATTTSLLFGDKKKVILITGCDSGFGFSLACHMSDTHREEFLTIACSYFSSSEGAEILRGKSNVKVLPLDSYIHLTYSLPLGNKWRTYQKPKTRILLSYNEVQYVARLH